MKRKTIEDFLNEVAKEKGFEDYDSFREWRITNNLGESEKAINEAKKRYTEYLDYLK